MKATYTRVEIDTLGVSIVQLYFFFSKAIFSHLADTFILPLLFPRALERSDTDKNPSKY